MPSNAIQDPGRDEAEASRPPHLPAVSPLAFPVGDSRMAAAIRALDWSATPLGAPEGWPAPLRAAVNLMLGSPESLYLVWGPELTFLFNDAYRPVLGPRLEGALGQSLPLLWADAWEAIRPSLEQALAGGASRSEDMPVPMARYGRSEQTWWSFSFSPLHREDGTVGGALCFTTETTGRVQAVRALAEMNATLAQQVAERTAARERLEAQLRQAQKMEAVGRLTGGLAHDFNNLLTGLTGSLELLQHRIARGQTEGVGRYVEAAQGAAQRAAALTHRLLSFARQQTLAPRPTDINALARTLEELIRHTMGPENAVSLRLAAEAWTARVDANQLENALLNLCINARDAMPEGGSLAIGTENRVFGAREAEALALPPGDYLVLSVADTGAGMTPEVIARAFDPFFTTKPQGEGTGLGLSMVYGFARQSGGQVHIHSVPGEGTRICLYLPRSLGAVAEAAAPAVGGAPAGRGETVLVVDDEPALRMLIGDLLREEGYRPILAEDGTAGLRALQSGARVNLMVTDVGLPGGMNGWQLARAARILRPALKVLFITGYARDGGAEAGGFGPETQLLLKPFALSALSARIGAMLAAP